MFNIIKIAKFSFVALCLFAIATAHSASTVADKLIDLADSGRLFGADESAFPDSPNALTTWLERRSPATKVNLFGGSYWLYADVRHSQATTEWVLDPNNTLIDRVEARIYAPDGSVQQLQTGYRHDHEFMLHYGKSMVLQPNVDYRILIKFSSPYFASNPRFEVLPTSSYRARVINDNVWILGCLGAVTALALFNIMLFASTRDKSALYYALYLIVFGIGWAFVFHIPAHLFGLRNLSLHYIPFFLTPVASALFCLDFLKLRQNFPRLAKLCVWAMVASLLLLPINFFAQKYAHIVASTVISLWLPLAIVCGLVSWRGGYRPARFFALAFIALLIPGALILPPNLGLMNDMIQNSELFTLVGGTVDGILLAFALADKIKLLGMEKDSYLMQLNHALKLAHTDSMTGIGNRHAFDLKFHQELKISFMEDDDHQPMLVLVDLDGLKLINDKYGHARGDDLLRAFAQALADLNIDHVLSYRLGGDEFAVLAQKHHATIVREKMEAIDRSLSTQGFGESGVSFGIAFASESSTPAEVFNAADLRMYEHKSMKKTWRHPSLKPS